MRWGHLTSLCLPKDHPLLSPSLTSVKQIVLFNLPFRNTVCRCAAAKLLASPLDHTQLLAITAHSAQHGVHYASVPRSSSVSTEAEPSSDRTCLSTNTFLYAIRP